MSILNEFTGSPLFPTRRSLDREDFLSLGEKAYILLLVTRVLLCIPASSEWAMRYLRQTIQANNLHGWRSNGTDLYVALYGLTQGQYRETGEHGHVLEQPFMRWLRAVRHDPNDVMETKRLFLKLDSMLHVHDGSLKAIRRLVQDWPHCSHRDHQLVVTRLLQIMRARMPRAESLKWLARAAREHNLEIEGADNQEVRHGNSNLHALMSEPERERRPGTAIGFLAGLAGLATGYHAVRGMRENATAGATSSASVAATPGGLGAGFDPNGHKGIYATAKPKKSKIIRR